MSSKKRLNRIEQAQHESEILDSQVRLDGVGEDKAIQELLSDKFVEATDSEALDTALALQQLIRGQNSVLEMLQGQGEAITKLKERMDKYDRDAQRWEQDRSGFLEEIQAKAESLRITDEDKKAKLIAKAGQHVQQEIQKAVAAKAVDDVQFTAWLESQPKVTVTSPGKPTQVNQNGVIVTVMEPEIIRIRNKSWTLMPNIPTDVPKPVADEFFSRQKIQQETGERQKILNANSPLDNVVMAQKWGEINKRFGSQTEIMMSDDR